jgi:hypothetical protein
MSKIFLSITFTGVCIPLYLFTFYRIIQATGALSREIIPLYIVSKFNKSPLIVASVTISRFDQSQILFFLIFIVVVVPFIRVLAVL